jgi:hypothetical protein
MNSKDKEDSKTRRREETLARRMGEALNRMDPRGADACPDAEIIAAYAEQALQPHESEQWEGHFAACARCRKILRVLAASAETPLAGKEVAQLGELVSAARPPAEIIGRSGESSHSRFADWRMRWLAPAVAVAAALAVWFAMRPPWRATERRAPQTLIAQVPKQEQEEDRSRRVEPQQDQKMQAEPGSALKKVSPNAAVGDGQLQKEENSEKRSDRSGARPSLATAPPPPQSAQAKTPIGAPSTPPAPQAQAQADLTIPSAPEVPPTANQSVAVTGSSPAVETTNGTLAGTIQREHSAELPMNGRNDKALRTLNPAREYSALFRAPSGISTWRAGKGGIIERSVDGGKTWASEASPSEEDWLAGTAVSGSVGWLVGRNGAIARTVDGDHWERVAPPAQARASGGKFADWTGITARDGQAATITAGDGRMFATPDGGMTWQPE